MHVTVPIWLITVRYPKLLVNVSVLFREPRGPTGLQWHPVGGFQKRVMNGGYPSVDPNYPSETPIYMLRGYLVCFRSDITDHPAKPQHNSRHIPPIRVEKIKWIPRA